MIIACQVSLISLSEKRGQEVVRSSVNSVGMVCLLCKFVRRSFIRNFSECFRLRLHCTATTSDQYQKCIGSWGITFRKLRAVVCCELSVVSCELVFTFIYYANCELVFSLILVSVYSILLISNRWKIGQ